MTLWHKRTYWYWRYRHKEFPVKALDESTTQFRLGTIHPHGCRNGAGKSIMMKCLFGIRAYIPGSIKLNFCHANKTQNKLWNKAFHGPSGTKLFKRSVMENIWLLQKPNLAWLTSIRCGQDTKFASATQLGYWSILIIIGKLSVSQRQMIETAKAVSHLMPR